MLQSIGLHFGKTEGPSLRLWERYPTWRGTKHPCLVASGLGYRNWGHFFAVHFPALRWNLAACCVFGTARALTVTSCWPGVF